MTHHFPNRRIQWRHLGLIDYQKAWDVQQQHFDALHNLKVANRDRRPQDALYSDHTLFTCEHPPVLTLGKSAKTKHLLHDRAFMKKQGISVVRTNRGGDVTYHGPGQMVVYPILDLDHFYTDIHRYMRELEEASIRTLADFGVAAGRYPGYTGVWIDADQPSRARKICAQGVKCSRWITMHGLALNVHTDLTPFHYIVPCGIRDKAVTTMALEMETVPSMEAVRQTFLHHFETIFQARLIAASGRTDLVDDASASGGPIEKHA